MIGGIQNVACLLGGARKSERKSLSARKLAGNDGIGINMEPQLSRRFREDSRGGPCGLAQPKALVVRLVPHSEPGKRRFHRSHTRATGWNPAVALACSMGWHCIRLVYTRVAVGGGSQQFLDLPHPPSIGSGAQQSLVEFAWVPSQCLASHSRWRQQQCGRDAAPQKSNR